jgi:hypothetical protein
MSTLSAYLSVLQEGHPAHRTSGLQGDRRFSIFDAERGDGVGVVAGGPPQA